MKHCTFFLVLAATLVSGALRAQVPQLVNYQGRVAVNGANFDGAGQFKFALVDANGSVTFWSNDGTSIGGSEPSAAVTLMVTQGLYSLLLGDTALGANMTNIPIAVFSNPDVRLRVWFNDGVHGSQLLAPDQRLAPATYLADGTVTSESVSDAAITAGKIAPAAVTGTNIAPASLDSSIFAVPGPPSDGQVLGYNNGGLTWTAPGGGVFSLNGTSAYYNGGSVGLGTSSPQAGLRLDVIGLTRLAPGGSGGAIQFGTPNTETGMTIFGTNRADIRFDGSTLKLLAATGIGAPPSANGIAINTAGAVGIGTATPQAKLHLFDPDPAHSVSARIQTSGGTNSWTRLEFTNGNGQWNIGTSRNFVGEQFYFARDGSAQAFTIQPNGDTWSNGTMSCKVLTIRGGADLAEPFPMKEEKLKKGSVVVIDAEHPGRLKQSTEAYDRRVAGIVSGANGINPGIALHQEGLMESGENVALSGRVYVEADASGGAIGPGDLLTTSDTPGHAMKVIDHARAQGAVIGKAMSTLAEGEGLVLVLVSLQ